MKRTPILAAVQAALLSCIVHAEEHVVSQKDKNFSTDKLTISVGDSVSFLNNDPFFHNIFSLSETATFDLGSYPIGESRSQVFEEAGVVEIECAIHPRMKLTIEVTDE